VIYLRKEIEAFTQTKHEFEEAYVSLLERALNIYQANAATRDVGSPIHHRQSPMSMLSLAQAKCRRIEARISDNNWERNKATIPLVIEECVDVTNYVLYIAALCLLLLQEEERNESGASRTS